MGIDISIAVETRDGADKPWQMVIHPDAAYNVRERWLFALLGFYETGVKGGPLSTIRGLPPDISPEAREALDSSDKGFGWVTLAEVRAFDWLRLAEDDDGPEGNDIRLREACPHFTRWLEMLMELTPLDEYDVKGGDGPHRMRFVYGFD